MNLFKNYLTVELGWQIEKGQQMINEKGRKCLVYPFFFNSSFCLRGVSSATQMNSFLSIWAYVDSLCHSPVEVVLLQQEGADEKNVGRDFCPTVIMQLVFECSYHTNVDRLHFSQVVFLFVFFFGQYSIVVFISPLLMSALNQVALSVQLTVACTFLSEAGIGVWV